MNLTFEFWALVISRAPSLLRQSPYGSEDDDDEDIARAGAAGRAERAARVAKNAASILANDTPAGPPLKAMLMFSHLYLCFCVSWCRAGAAG